MHKFTAMHNYRLISDCLELTKDYLYTKDHWLIIVFLMEAAKQANLDNEHIVTITIHIKMFIYKKLDI